MMSTKALGVYLIDLPFISLERNTLVSYVLIRGLLSTKPSLPRPSPSEFPTFRRNLSTGSVSPHYLMVSWQAAAYSTYGLMSTVERSYVFSLSV